ncbi:MAG: TSUP family transporter [Propionibacteriaceae bacterium]|jgi:uncharacterized membrane protein YfcA|nr:TSUP family transporter [Propionibacteriaceae bacterium]
MLDLSVLTLIAICVASLVAGWVNAVVGGGGVIQMPALLIALPSETPVATISGTNKLGSISGTAAACAAYIPKMSIQWPTVIVAIVFAYAGATAGANLVQYVPRSVFIPIIIVVVALVGIHTLRNPQLGQISAEKYTGRKRSLISAGIGTVCGIWDGVIGPGTGIFLILGFVVILGFGFLEASAMAKLVNLTSNLAALIVLGVTGHVLWFLGGLMALCSLIGGFIGAHMALKYGNSFIRRIFLIAVIILEVRLIYDAILLFM